MATTRRILVIEDEPSISENLIYSLGSEGFEVAAEATGGGGLAHFSGEQAAPDLVILDVGLPDMSGFDVCREIRSKSSVPVVFLTARESEIDRVVGLELGADDYVVKPFSPRELVARVRAILRRSDGSTDGNLERNSGACAGPFSVDEKRHRISCEDRALDLSRYEYGLLKLFIEHPGRVYSRDQLMEQVWDEPDSSLDRTVDAHIKSLRAKLREVSGGADAIVTHRGVGYSLKEDW
jgi:two-component system catabolic regulation response regulator CreB